MHTGDAVDTRGGGLAVWAASMTGGQISIGPTLYHPKKRRQVITREILPGLDALSSFKAVSGPWGKLVGRNRGVRLGAAVGIRERPPLHLGSHHGAGVQGRWMLMFLHRFRVFFPFNYLPVLQILSGGDLWVPMQWR